MYARRLRTWRPLGWSSVVLGVAVRADQLRGVNRTCQVTGSTNRLMDEPSLSVSVRSCPRGRPDSTRRLRAWGLLGLPGLRPATRAGAANRSTRSTAVHGDNGLRINSPCHSPNPSPAWRVPREALTAGRPWIKPAPTQLSRYCGRRHPASARRCLPMHRAALRRVFRFSAGFDRLRNASAAPSPVARRARPASSACQPPASLFSPSRYATMANPMKGRNMTKASPSSGAVASIAASAPGSIRRCSVPGSGPRVSTDLIANPFRLRYSPGSTSCVPL